MYYELFNLNKQMLRSVFVIESKSVGVVSPFNSYN